MDVKFDLYAAEQLLDEMEEYCTSLQTESLALLHLVDNLSFWNDSQKEQFARNIEILSQNLNQVLIMQSDYMNIYAKRIDELKG